MIHHLIFHNLAVADLYSRVAQTLGSGDSVTMQRSDAITHPVEGAAALVVPEGMDLTLPETDRTQLVEHFTVIESDEA